MNTQQPFTVYRLPIAVHNAHQQLTKEGGLTAALGSNDLGVRLLGYRTHFANCNLNTREFTYLVELTKDAVEQGVLKPYCTIEASSADEVAAKPTPLYYEPNRGDNIELVSDYEALEPIGGMGAELIGRGDLYWLSTKHGAIEIG
ncbi:hypothetical protein [Vibrio crassostreae]|uniref:hypothetical protein n=1 Tax=Vibrio crassostreae TaxID=246167 RepID=UPI001B307599|nr:hypothetical protein [Vibrio crassostreae]